MKESAANNTAEEVKVEGMAAQDEAGPDEMVAKVAQA